MKKLYSIIIIAFISILIILSARAYNNRVYKKPDYSGGSNPTSYVYPGEFEKQQAIWMQWPVGVYSEILLNSTDQEGKPFRIIRIPMPPTLYGEVDYTGKIPVRSYLNYAVTNGAVLMQTYWKTGRSDKLKTTEDQVRGIFQSVFPGRNIIGINAESVNLWGGGIHCITQQMPAN